MHGHNQETLNAPSIYADAPREKSGKQYLHEIVANGRNGLDVDKFDYLQRDARCCGVLIAADIDRLRTFSKVCDTKSESVPKESAYHFKDRALWCGGDAMAARPAFSCQEPRQGRGKYISMHPAHSCLRSSYYADLLNQESLCQSCLPVAQKLYW